MMETWAWKDEETGEIRECARLSTLFLSVKFPRIGATIATFEDAAYTLSDLKRIWLNQ